MNIFAQLSCCSTKRLQKITFISISVFLAVLIVYSYLYTQSFIIQKDSKPKFVKIVSNNLRSNCDCRKNEEIKIELYDDETMNIYKLTSTKQDSYNIDTKIASIDNVTCDLYNVLRRGMGQKIIGLSLYGTDERYYKSFKIIAKQAQKYYPGWIIRVYYDNSINKSAICDIECLKDENGYLYDNIDFCDASNIPNGHPNKSYIWSADYIHAAMIRWLPLGDPFVDMFVSRDSDSWIHDREYYAVKEWLNSNTLFHLMRDHPFHTVEMLAGMWGYANKKNRDLAYNLYSILVNKTIAKEYNGNKNFKGNDQRFLTFEYWKYAIVNLTAHASFFCNSFFDNAKPFPTQRSTNGECFATCSLCCDRDEYGGNWTYECPIECRPKDHKNWIYC